MATNLSNQLGAGIARVSRIVGLGLTGAALLATTTVSAQVSESTEEWPVWQKVAVGTLGAASLLSTIALIAVSNADVGESNSDANGNARKGQGYVEELKDELLLLVNVGDFGGDFGGDSADSVDSLAVEYPVLASYYRELMAEHPEVIDATNENIQGATLVERLNRVMVAHLFGME